MVRLDVRITVDSSAGDATVRMGQGLLQGLRLEPGWTSLRFGTRRVRVQLAEDNDLQGGQVVVPAAVAGRLDLPGPLRTSIQREEDGGIALGPLIGLLLAPGALERLRGDGLRPPYTEYARYARELGAVLCLFTPRDVDLRREAVAGYRPEREGRGRWRLRPGRFPVPRVVLRRVSSQEGRDTDSFTSRAGEVGCTVLRFGGISQLEGLLIAAAHPDLAPLVPWTRRLRPDTLAAALRDFDDLFLKPDIPSGGPDIYQLTRRPRGWLLRRLGPGQPAEQLLPDADAVREALRRHLASRAAIYLVQEGLPLATYLGNRFDLFALVQKDGHGRWDVSGLVARISAPGKTITSPDAGGWVAPAEAAVRHAFTTRWPDVWEEVRRVAVTAAQAVDGQRGPRFELGVQLAVLRGGKVRLVQVDGEPQVGNLFQVHDPFTAQRIYRCPIYCAAGVDFG